LSVNFNVGKIVSVSQSLSEIEEYCSKLIKELVESEKEVRENEKY
jgi:hypothetical protein